MIDAMISPEAMSEQIRSIVPAEAQISQDQYMRLGQVLSAALSEQRPLLEETMVQSTAEVFTDEEISAMYDFHSSDTGASIMAKTQPYMAVVYEKFGPEMMRAVFELQPKVAEILQE